MVYLYCRTSTRSQKYGLETQETYLRDFMPPVLKGQPVTIIKEQVSGKSLQNRKLDSLIDALSKGDSIMFYDVSRIGRETVDVLLIVRRIHAKGASTWIDQKLFDPESADQELNISIAGAFATYQRRIQNQKSRSGIKVKKGLGEWVYSGKLLGYKVDHDKVTIVEEEAELIRWIYKEYCTGRSLLNIEKELDAKGIKSRKNNKLYSATLRRYLLKPIYMGYYMPVDNKKAIYTQINREQLIKSTIYPPIVSEDEWWQVYESFRTLPRKHARQFQYRRSRHQLSGILRCGYCGARYVHYMAKKFKEPRPYYVCRVHQKGCEQSLHSFQESIIVALFDFAFRLMVESPHEIETFFTRERENSRQRNSALRIRAEVFEKEIQEAVSQEQAIVKLMISKHEDEGLVRALQEQRLELDRKRQSNQEELRKVFAELEPEMDEETLIGYREKLIKEYEETAQEDRRNIFKRVVASAKVNKETVDILFFTGRLVSFRLHERRKGSYVQRVFEGFTGLGDTLTRFSFDTKTGTQTILRKRSVEDQEGQELVAEVKGTFQAEP